MDSGRIIYLNGEFLPEKQARISVYDSALMFGDMVFEMTRSFNKKQFKIREHLERLYRSMNYLHIKIPHTVEELEKICYEVLERNDKVFEAHDEHRLMVNISRGPLSFYSEIFDGKVEPTVVITDFPFKWTVATMGPLYNTGVNAAIPAQRAIPASLQEPKVKNRSRMFYMMANIEVSNMSGDRNWALLLDPDGFITEGTGSNFFIVKDNKLISPEPRNVLRGVSMEYVINELAPALGLEHEYRNIEPYDVMNADEAFYTATPFCMMPCTSINNYKIGTAEVGEVFTKLITKWGENVGVDIIKQIKDYGEEVSDLRAKQKTMPSTYQFVK